MEKKNKIIISSVVGLTLFGMAFGEDTEKENNSKTIDNKTDTEIKETFNTNQNIPNDNNTDENKSVENNINNDDDANAVENNDEQGNENNLNDYNPNNNQTSSQEPEINNSTSSNNSTNNESTSSEQLPLKAICNDGTISYQDDASKPNYRGMCSGHQGIKTRLGRIK